MVSEVCHSLLWKSCTVQHKENFDGANWQSSGALGFCDVTQTGGLMPGTTACCHNGLFRQRQMIQISRQSLYSSILCTISQSKPLDVASDSNKSKVDSSFQGQEDCCNLYTVALSNLRGVLPQEIKLSDWNTSVVTDKKKLYFLWKFMETDDNKSTQTELLVRESAVVCAMIHINTVWVRHAERAAERV